MACHSSNTVIPVRTIKTRTLPYSRKPSESPSLAPSRFRISAHQNTSFMAPVWTVSEIAEAVNGEILKWGPSGTICTDTRTMSSTKFSSAGQWFFAIVGQNFDAHDFISTDLYRKGCVGVIGHRICENWEKGFVKVDEKDDTVSALEKMAKSARNRYQGRVVGVTGSVGKTTTRTMIALALESLGPVYQTHGNQNNLIGVALSLIGIPGNAEVSVLELGMCRKGEILQLARMCEPSVRVILNVGPSHLENFGDLEEVAGAKGEITMEAKPGDVCVLNADDPLVMKLPVPPGVRKVLFGQRVGCDVRLLSAEVTNGGHGVKVVLERDMEVVQSISVFRTLTSSKIGRGRYKSLKSHDVPLM